MGEPDAHTPTDLKWCQRVDEIVTNGWSPKELPAVIAPGILIGGARQAEEPEILHSLGVTHILNMASGICATGSHTYDERFTYMGIDADDDPAYDLLGKHFAEASDFLCKCRAVNGCLFIHCMAGINRSGAMALAFLIADGMDLLSAVRHGHRVRGPILWNKGFQLQLVRFARERDMLHDDAPA